MGAPRVSVLLPVYNGARYLREAVDGILRQEFGDLELIVVNDASPDRSSAILGSYSDPRLVVITHPVNRGQTEALRTAMAAASGELVARQDQDDISGSARLGRQVAFLDAHPEVDLVGCGCTLMDAEGRPIQGGVLEYEPIEPVELAWRFLWTDMLADTTLMMRRAAVERAGGYDPAFRIAQDFDLESRLCSRGLPARLSDRLVSLRLHGASSSSRSADAQDREVCRVIGHALERLLGEVVPEATAARVGSAIGGLEPRSADDGLLAARYVSRALAIFLSMRSLRARDERAVKQAAAELMAKLAVTNRDRLGWRVLQVLRIAFAWDPILPVRPAVWRRWRAGRRYRRIVASAWRGGA